MGTRCPTGENPGRFSAFEFVRHLDISIKSMFFAPSPIEGWRCTATRLVVWFGNHQTRVSSLVTRALLWFSQDLGMESYGEPQRCRLQRKKGLSWRFFPIWLLGANHSKLMLPYLFDDEHLVASRSYVQSAHQLKPIAGFDISQQKPSRAQSGSQARAKGRGQQIRTQENRSFSPTGFAHVPSSFYR